VLVALPGGTPAVNVDKINSVEMENFKLLGSMAAGNQGAASITLTVTNGGALTLVNSELIAGSGAPGAPGAIAAPGAKGGNANGQSGGTNSGCSSTQGGAGAGEMGVDHKYTECDPICGADGCWGASGAPGDMGSWQNEGAAGSPAAYFCPPITPNSTSSAGAGRDASCGTGGTPATDTSGTFARSTWTGSVGQSG